MSTVNRTLRVAVGWMLASVGLVACGAKSPLRILHPGDVIESVDAVDVVDVVDVARTYDGCAPVNDRCAATEICGNGADDNCNGAVDEACVCTPGDVQSCFAGPPGRRNIGDCRDGAQTCLMTGAWGECRGGILPAADVCNGTDNLCNGCSQQADCPISCPGPNDPRVPDGLPFHPYPLRGELFYMGMARAWHWNVQGGPCDTVGVRPSYTVAGQDARDATFSPLLSGDYTITLTVVTLAGSTLQCTWIVHIAGPGLRVELCYPENTTVDLDLYVHGPMTRDPWFTQPTNVYSAGLDQCDWGNCEAVIRENDQVTNLPVPRADWGYPHSPLDYCAQGPHGPQWIALGFCGNPRLDVDNNLDPNEGIGLPENINIDTPGEGETFRVMVQNFSGPIARPVINVYCNGRRAATYGLAPDTVPNFRTVVDTTGGRPVGTIWRAADVTTHLDAMGATTCTVQALHPFGSTTGYDVTRNNESNY